MADLETDVLVEQVGTELEEIGGVAHGAGGGAVGHGLCDGLLVDVVEPREVERQVGAVFAAERGLLGNLVVDLQLGANLAVGLAGVAVIANELVGVLTVDGRDAVDHQLRVEIHHAVGTELHVVGTDERGGNAEPLHRVGGRQEESLAGLVDEIVAHVRVVDLAGVLTVDAETLVAEGRACRPRAHIVGDLLTGNVGDGSGVGARVDFEKVVEVGGLMAAHKAGADAGGEPLLLDDGEHLPEREFQIATAEKVLAADVGLEVVTLHTPHTLQVDALVGGNLHSSAEQTVVHAELPVFVGPEDQTVAELLVVVARRDLQERVFVVGEEVLDALPFVADFLEIDERELVELVPRTGRETTVAVQNVEEGIAAHFRIHLFGPDDGVRDVVHAVEAEVTTDAAVAELVLSKRQHAAEQQHDDDERTSDRSRSHTIRFWWRLLFD